MEKTRGRKTNNKKGEEKVNGEQLEFWSLPPIQGPVTRTARPKKRKEKPAMPSEYLGDKALAKAKEERGEK